MTTRVRTTLAATAAVLGLIAAPAAAASSPSGAAASGTGCPTIGEEWSAWALLGPDYEYPTGQWTAEAARTGTALGYPVESGPGVISRVIGFYCE